MKTNRSSRPTIIGAAPFLAGMFAVGTLTTNAGFVFTLTESGGDVVGTVSGTVNLDGLSHLAVGYSSGFVWASSGYLMLTGPASSPGVGELYSGIAGPSSFGTGGNVAATTGSGAVGIFASNSALFLPSGYTSGDPLSANATWSGQSFASMGLTPGTYTWTWGGDVPADYATLEIGVVPEPSHYALVAGMGLLAFGVWRRHAKR